MKRPEHIDNLGILAVFSKDKRIVHTVQDGISLCLVRSCHLAIRIFIVIAISAGIGAGIFLCVLC